MDRDSLPPQSLLRHASFVRELARSLTRDVHAAEDLAQDAWLSVLRRPPHHALNLRGWLSTVLRRSAHRRARVRSRRAEHEQASAHAEALPSSAEEVSQADALRHVTEAVTSLEEPYRRTLIERYYHGLSAAEIAKRHGIPAATVRSHIKRALIELRRRLDSRMGGREAWCTALLALGKGGLAMSTSTKIAAGTILIVGLVLIPTLRDSMTHPDKPEVAEATPAVVLVTGGPVAPRAQAESEVAPEPAARREALVLSAKSAAEAATGSLRVRVVYAADGEPAAGIGVFAHPWNSSTSVLDRDAIASGPRATTDAEGIAILQELAPGHFLVETDHSVDIDSSEIRAGERAELVIELAGIDLQGVVVDEDGVPVPGASVELSEWARVPVSVPKPVAVTDAGGRFEVRAVPSLCSVGARAPGHAPSVWQQVQGGEAGLLELRLALQGPGGRLAGRVVGPDGAPVPHAAVLVGRLRMDLSTFTLPDGSNAIEARGRRVLTDAEGRFRLDDCPRGQVPVAVRAREPEFAPWTGTATLDAHGTSVLEIALEPGVIVTGVVREADGRPAAHVEIEVKGEQPFTDRNLVTAADGSYRLAAVPGGEFEVSAETEERGRASATLAGAPGEIVTWNPQLGLGLELHGLVLDDGDEPVEGAFVHAYQQGNPDWSGWSDSDSDGRFALANCPEGGGLVVEVEAADRGSVRRKGVDPLDGELVVRLPRVQQPVRIVGDVRGPGGEPVATATLMPRLAGQNSWRSYSTVGQTGRIEIEELLPGTYALVVEAPGLAGYRSRPREVAPGDTWDVGTILLEEGGTLAVEVAETALTVYLQLFDGEGRWVENIPVGKESGLSRSSLQAAGSYGLFVTGDDETAAQWIPVELRAGEDTRVEVRVSRGILTDLHFAVRTPLLLRIEGGGRVVCRRFVSPRDGEATHFEVALEAGPYTVEARTEDGLSGRREFVVDAEVVPLRIDVDLR